MINLRYHIVSIVAVFLALAIGIAMGSTVISKATVDDLRTRIRNAENGIDKTKAENKVLSEQLNSLASANQRALEKLVPTVVAGRLKNVPVVVVATPDVDQDHLRQTEATLVASGASIKATLSFDRRLADLAGDPANSRKLADLVGTSFVSSDGSNPARLWQLAAKQLGTELRQTTVAAPVPEPPVAPASVPGSAVPVPTAPVPTSAAPATTVPPPDPFLALLQGGGFVDVNTAGKSDTIATVLAGRGYRMVVVGEPATPPTPGKAVGFDAQFMVPLLQSLTAGGGAPVVVGSFADPQPSNAKSPDAVREWFLGPIHDDKALDGKLTTVNDLELVQGQVVLVLALVEVGSGKHGRYGIGGGADALAPAGS